MNTVFSLHDIPNSRLHVSAQVADEHRSLGDVLSMTQEKLGRQLAHTILALPNVFRVGQPARGYFQIDADVIVLTPDEFRQLMQEQFKKGVSRAQGFQPHNYDLQGRKL